MKYFSYYEFPIGTLGIGEDGVGISHIFLPGTADVSAAVQKETPLIAAAAAQLREYFAGARKVFDLPLIRISVFDPGVEDNENQYSGCDDHIDTDN